MQQQSATFFPNSRLYVVWTHVTLLATMWYVLTVPLFLVPIVGTPSWSNNVNLVLTCVYTIDILIRFRLAFLENGDFVTSPDLIRHHYSRTWLIPDLVGTFPWDFAAILLGYPAWAVPLSTLRLVRVARIIQLSQQSTSGLPLPIHSRLLFMLFWIVAAVIWIACGWLFLTPPDGVRDAMTEVIEACYWAVVTLASVGYGDITPKDNIGRLYSIFVIMIGVGMYGFVIGNFTSLMTNANIIKQRARERTANLAAFLGHYELPSRMREDIFSFMRHMTVSQGAHDMGSIDELPKKLRTSIIEHITVQMLQEVRLFHGASPELLVDLARSVKQEVFTPGEEIIRAGDVGREMFFLVYGSVSVFTADGNFMTKLKKKTAFGEMALLYETPRTATIRANTFCSVLKLEKKDFEAAIEKHSSFRVTLEAYVRARLEKQETQNKTM